MPGAIGEPQDETGQLAASIQAVGGVGGSGAPELSELFFPASRDRPQRTKPGNGRLSM